MTDSLYSVYQAARFLGVHRATLYRWLNLGKIVAIELSPHHLYFTKEELARVKAQHRTKELI